MRDDDLKRFLVGRDNLPLEMRGPSDTKILESVLRNQVRRHPLMKDGIRDCGRVEPEGPNETP